MSIIFTVNTELQGHVRGFPFGFTKSGRGPCTSVDLTRLRISFSAASDEVPGLLCSIRKMNQIQIII